MPVTYRTFATGGFRRDARRLTKQNPLLIALVDRMLSTLEQDPYNVTGRYDIKKLAGVSPGNGQWRLRFGNYRLRYDIMGQDVILYSLRHRKEAY